jgi:hypothetical protein
MWNCSQWLFLCEIMHILGSIVKRFTNRLLMWKDEQSQAVCEINHKDLLYCEILHNDTVYCEKIHI